MPPNGKREHLMESRTDRRREKQGANVKAERRIRTVRLFNLPEATQEGLLQQALEKIVPVVRLELFAKSHEAIAELSSQAVRIVVPHQFVTDSRT